MLKNYLIIAWRNLYKNKLISFINIFGLTISICICLLISLFIHDEINYDTFQKDHENIYRLELIYKTDRETKHWAATPPALKDFAEHQFPEVAQTTRLMPSTRTSIVTGEKKFKEDNCFLADPSIFDVMGLALLKGVPSSALKDPHAVVLSEKTAGKLFGSVSAALDQTLAINNYPLKVTGILKDIPANSHLQIGLLRSINILKENNNTLLESWAANILYTYVKVKAGADINLLSDKLAGALITYGIARKQDDFHMKFHRVSDLHLDGNIEKELTPNSSWIFIYIFITVGFLILLLASINYINLTTSRSLGRAKEIGVRKTLGAFRKNLVLQFLSESVFITLFSFGIAVLAVYLALPLFNTITGKSLSLLSLFNPFVLFIAIAIILFIGILAGIYPAFVISSFDPVTAIKGAYVKNKNSYFSLGLRKSLVVFQFVVSAFLVISSVAVIKQISYMFNKPLGYSRENVIVIPVPHPTYNQVTSIKTDLEKNRDITEVSAISAVPGKRVMLEATTFEGQQVVGITRMLFADKNYLKAMGMEIVQGRNFDAGIASDTSEAVIINEAAVRQMGWKEPLGKKIEMNYLDKVKHGRVIGVVKDFHYGSLHNLIEPVVIHLDPWYEQLVVKYRPGSDLEKIKQQLNETWSRLFPNDVFTSTFLDDDLKMLYRSEDTLKQLLLIFTLFAILIAAVGLFGLIYFSNTIRKKEISIRKVLGASSKSIIYLLSKEYFILIAISLLVSIPLSNYALNKWLNNFAYRMEVSLLPFMMGILVTLLIAFATIIIQGMKAALSNPINNIRTE